MNFHRLFKCLNSTACAQNITLSYGLLVAYRCEVLPESAGTVLLLLVSEILDIFKADAF